MTEANDSKTLLRLMRSRIYNRNSSDSLSYYEVYRRFRTKYLTRHDLLDEEKLLIHLRETVGLPNEDLGDLFSRISVFTRIIQDHCIGNNFNISRHENIVWNMRHATPLYDASAYDLTQCEDCDGYDNHDEMIFIEGSGEITVCQSCCDGDYRYSEEDGCYYHIDDYPDWDDDYEDGCNDGKYSYDADVVRIMKNSGYSSRWINEGLRMPSDDKDEMLLGLEAEWEIRDEDDMYALVEDMHTQMRGFAIVKHDGSLDNGGEIVTIPATLKSQKYRWTQFCESKTNFTNRCKAWHTSTCGTHIHVDRRAVTPLEIGKLLLFVNGKHNSSFITTFAGRGVTQWCKRYAKNIKDGLERTDKYESINTGKPNTIEFRMFRGNLSKSGIMRNLEFVHSLVRFVKQSPYDIDTDSLIDLRYENFVKWVGLQDNRGMYPYLYKWLVKNSFTGRGKTNTIRENEVNECA